MDASDRPGGDITAGQNVKLYGDAHLPIVGVFASHKRTRLISLNDLDETLPKPW